jgi:DnaJ-class molecular chaperone
MPNPDFGNGEPPDPEWDESEAPQNPDYAYTCKHCDALGGECYTCDGEGEIVESVNCLAPDGREFPDEVESECPTCQGHGVLIGLAYTGWRED